MNENEKLHQQNANLLKELECIKKDFESFLTKDGREERRKKKKTEEISCDLLEA